MPIDLVIEEREGSGPASAGSTHKSPSLQTGMLSDMPCADPHGMLDQVLEFHENCNSPRSHFNFHSYLCNTILTN